MIQFSQVLIDKKKYIIANEGDQLVYLGWDLNAFKKKFPKHTEMSSAIQKQVIMQLKEFLAGDRQGFDVPTKFYGTDFQKAVWKKLGKIAYGKTLTYGELAQKLGKPNASRAIGAACGKNPIAIMYPCHRVIGKSGALTGFAGGIDLKKKLLKIEGHIV
tara:strand:+ start:1550 stop:2026 length:477 start_codon:yes stop_codon:yes gene_type:complete